MIMHSKEKDRTKRTAITLLLVISGLIIGIGTIFGIFCAVLDVSYQVLGFNVPGFLFGAVAAFLGIRYFKSALKLKKTLASSKESFHWSYFKFTN